MSLIRVLKFITAQGWPIEFVDMVEKFDLTEHDTDAMLHLKDHRLYIARKLMREYEPMYLIMTVLHEAGHIMSFVRGWCTAGRHYGTERKAYLYGWAVAKKFGIVINKSDWRLFNWEIFDQKETMKNAA